MNIKKPLIFLVGLLLISTTLVGAYTSVSGIRLPDTSVALNVVDGTTSYFVSTLSGVPAGNDVTNGTYPGWCCEYGPHMTRSTNIPVTLYDSYGSLPARAQDGDWDKVNWILNNKAGYSMLDVQYAIWYLISEETFDLTLTAESQYLVDHAVDNFQYKAGDIIAIVAVPQTGNQTSIIELRIPSIPETCCRWTGGGTIGLNRNPRVTHGFELHCNVSQLPNNLEVNWGGDHFHLDVLTKVVCWDNLSINPKPPRASCDTIHGWGDGKYNGVSGYHVEFNFTDAGEPGTGDWAWIKITNPKGGTVMEVSGFLKSGNQQAHRCTGIDT